jgi:hypothetical protein
MNIVTKGGGDKMKPRLIQWFAIVLIIEIGLLHIMTAQGEYDEAAYMGYLFAANFFGALIAAFGIYHRQFWGWMLGLVIAIGSIAGYAWSRTLGMPGMNVEEWGNPYGIVSMGLEGLFILLVLLRPWKFTNDLPSSPDPRLRFTLPLAGLLMVAALTGVTYRWDYNVTQAFGHHVGSLAEVCSTPVTSMGQLEDEYGVQVSLIANSMMGSIVDVRLKIVDPDKAHALLQNQAALLLGQESLILAPHMHSHGSTRLKVGKEFIIFFPSRQIVHPGSNVSLVFGSVRVEPVMVR